MENKEESIKILRTYAQVIEIFGIIGMAICIIGCIIAIGGLMIGGPGAFSIFLGCAFCGALSFLSSKVIAAFIKAYANQCEDVHNIYMQIKQG